MLTLGVLLWLGGAAINQAAETKAGQWVIKDTSDGFSDAKRGIAHTPIESDGVFVVKCDSPGPGKVYVQFLTPKYLGSDNVGRRQFHTGKYRLDDGPIADLPRPYYDGKSAALLDAGPTTVFLNTLTNLNPKRFRAQFLTYDGDMSNIDIDVTGISDTIKKTAALCQDSSLTQ